MIQAEDFGSKPQKIIKGHKWDVVIYYIQVYKIIFFFNIEMIIHNCKCETLPLYF